MNDRQQVQIRVSPSVEVFLSGAGDLYLLPPDDRLQQRLPAPWGAPFFSVLARCEDGEPLVEALHAISDPKLRATLHAVACELQQRGILITEEFVEYDAPEWKRYDRQLRWFAQCGQRAVHAQRLLADASVLIIGLGGVGGAVAQALARAGIGSMTGVDHELVEDVNLPRQSLYHASDVGRSKVEVFAERVVSVSPTCNAVGVHQLVVSPQQIDDLITSNAAQVVVGAADTPADSFSQSLADACHNTNTPYVVAGQRVPEVIAGPFIIPGSTPCMQCCSPTVNHEAAYRALMQELNEWRAQARFVVPAVGIADEIAGAMLASDIIALLTATHSPALAGITLHLDVQTMTTRRIVHHRRASCATCGSVAMSQAA